MDLVFPGPVTTVPRHDREPIAAVVTHSAVAPDSDSQRKVFTADIFGRGLDADRILPWPDVSDSQCGDHVGRTGIGRVEALGDENIVTVAVAPEPIAPGVVGTDYGESWCHRCHVQRVEMWTGERGNERGDEQFCLRRDRVRKGVLGKEWSEDGRSDLYFIENCLIVKKWE